MTRNRTLGLAALLIALVLTALLWPAGPRVSAAAEALDPLDPSTPSLATAALRFDRTERPSAAALYNLGVAWLAQGDAPRAIAAFRAAGELSPRASDVVHNLALARADLDEDLPEPVEVSLSWMAIVSPLEVGLLALLAWLASAALLQTARRQDRPMMPGALTMVVAGALSTTALQGRAQLLEHPVAVTLEDAAVRDGPELDAEERHGLPPGAELRVLRSRGAFLLIEDGEARRGWVLRDAVAVGAT